MHLAIDVREACRRQRTGKGQWTHGFVSELIRRRTKLLLFTDADLPSSWQGVDKVTEVRLGDPGMRWHLRALRHVLADSFVGCYVSPTSYIVPFLLRGRRPCVTVIHDCIAFQRGSHQAKARFLERLTLPRVLDHARTVCTVSETTKRDLLGLFPSLREERVRVLSAGPLRSGAPPNVGDRPVILCVGTLCPRKNQARLIEAYRMLPVHLRTRFTLLLAGARGWRDRGIIDAAKRTPGVSWLGYISDSEYVRLLTHCSVFALPSLYEGFGMQLLDALQCGIPVLTSDRGSMREVAGEAALLVDPESAVSIRDGLICLLPDAPLREKLRKEGPARASAFTWKRVVDEFLRCLEYEDPSTLLF